MTVGYRRSNKYNDTKLCAECKVRLDFQRRLPMTSEVATQVRWWHRAFAGAMWRDKQEAEGHAARTHSTM